MLVTNTGGLSEIVPNESCGYVVENNTAEISSKLLDFFEKEREAEFTSNVEKEKKKYEWTAFIAALERLYSKCRNTGKNP
jgi:glycosyltransferase involved in cell wall biosynthesis